MNPNHYAASTDRYLDGRVLTASQPQLQLMLLEGACRFGRQALHSWDDATQTAECDRMLARTMAIAEELVRSVTSRGVDAAARLEEEYAFAFRQLATCHVNRDANALEAALRVFEFHRETWRLACDNSAENATAPATPASATPHASPRAPAFLGGFGAPTPSGSASFSFEA